MAKCFFFFFVIITLFVIGIINTEELGKCHVGLIAEVWHELCEFHSPIDAHWCLVGDFNMISKKKD